MTCFRLVQLVCFLFLFFCFWCILSSASLFSYFWRNSTVVYFDSIPANVRIHCIFDTPSLQSHQTMSPWHKTPEKKGKIIIPEQAYCVTLAHQQLKLSRQTVPRQRKVLIYYISMITQTMQDRADLKVTTSCFLNTFCWNVSVKDCRHRFVQMWML